MDCAAEERLVRMALHGHQEVHRIDADLGARELVVVHHGTAEHIASLVRPLQLGAKIRDTNDASGVEVVQAPSSADEARALKVVLAVNAECLPAKPSAREWRTNPHCWPTRSTCSPMLSCTPSRCLAFIVRRRLSSRPRALSGVLQLLLASAPRRGRQTCGRRKRAGRSADGCRRTRRVDRERHLYVATRPSSSWAAHT